MSDDGVLEPDLSRSLAAVIAAADVANIGISISVLREGSSRCVFATQTAASIMGVGVEALVGHSLRDFIVPEDVAKLSALATGIRADPTTRGARVEINAKRPDGTVHRIELAYAPTKLGEEPAVVSFVINVGEREAAEQRAVEIARRLSQIIEQTPDAIVISRQGVVVEANPAAASILGVGSPQELVGQPLARYVVPEDAVLMRERMGRVARGEHPGPPMVYRAHRADGRQVLVEIASFASEYQGQPAIIAFGRDVTVRERLQEQLARTERLAALGTLAAGVAHEINNPLAALSLNVEVAQRVVSRASLSAQDRELGIGALAELRASVERMTAIVRDLTGFTRTTTEQLAPVEVSAVVERALRVSRHATRHRAQVRTEVAGVPSVHGHAGKLEQVLVNLVVNAAQAFPDGSHEATNEIRIRAWALDEQRVALEVSDNGPGIPPQVASRVFDPFFTTKPIGEGTGLGLFVSHNAVRQMEGEITLDSAVGRGTSMRIVLRKSATQAPQPAEPPALSTATRRARVLIIDDEPALCRTLKILLSDTHDASTVASGEAALERVKSEGPYDALVCDLMMPGMTGMELYEVLEREHPGVERRMIFMTGGAFTEQARTFLGNCTNLRLQKPFAAQELNQAINKVMAGG